MVIAAKNPKNNESSDAEFSLKIISATPKPTKDKIQYGSASLKYL